MPFSFLTPLFLAGIAALSIPVLIHLIQREKKQVIEFPSLMFLRKVPYQSVRRQRLKRLLLLLVRCLALLLLVAAFARPFLPNARTVATTRSAREVVILLDRSYSMGYGDRWTRARAAAQRAIDALAPGDRGSLLLFDTRADAVVRSSPAAVRLNVALDGARTGAGGTRYGPALKLAQSILAGSEIAQKELIVISDFQRAGWRDAERLELPAGTKVMPVAIVDPKTENVAVTSVLLHPSDSTGSERVRVEARIANQSARPLSALRVALALDGQSIQTRTTDVPAHGAASVLFDPLATTASAVRATISIPHDALPADDELHFVLTTEQSVPTLVLDGGQSGQPSLYLRRALAIGGEPRFRVTQKPMSALAGADFRGRALLVINDASMPQGELGRRLRGWVEDGGGLFIVAGPHASDNGARDWLPGTLGSVIERVPERPGTIGWVDASNPIFEVFAAPRTGDFPAARVFHYRTLGVAQGAHVLARFDDGAPALVERQVGKGTVLEWTSTLDNDWSDIALQPVFLPFVQQVARRLSGYGKSRPWHTVGELVDVSDVRSTEGVPQPLVARSPSGTRTPLDATAHAPVLPLEEAGFYEVRPARSTARDALVIASNVDPAESDLSSFDPRELVSALAVRAQPKARTADTVAPPEQERAQAMWKYLLAAGLLLLVAETVFANRITRGRNAATQVREAT